MKYDYAILKTEEFIRGNLGGLVKSGQPIVVLTESKSHRATIAEVQGDKKVMMWHFDSTNRTDLWVAIKHFPPRNVFVEPGSEIPIELKGKKVKTIGESVFSSVASTVLDKIISKI